ncbi:MAG TPA: hypothetical protein VLT62_30465 [Candidatus Methylomirabilis sp.]|nr:hypothetical protein [Candidatus Methylomirabilis sp.]
MAPLKLADMKTGDVLLLKDATSAFSHMAIALGQALLSHRVAATSRITHAGIYDETGTAILEASGAKGLRAMDITKKQSGFTFQVYRCVDLQAVRWNVPPIAVMWARDFIERKESGSHGSFGNYSCPPKALLCRANRGKGAVAAVEKLRADPYAERTFYCSNFVVECYELACMTQDCDPVFSVDFRKITPKTLQSTMRRKRLGGDGGKWSYMGDFIVAG